MGNDKEKNGPATGRNKRTNRNYNAKLWLWYQTSCNYQ